MCRIINSLLDTDFYKFTMGQIFYERFNGMRAKYVFKDRTNAYFRDEMILNINEAVDHLCSLHFKDEEIEYLRSLNVFSEDYLKFLSELTLPRECIDISGKDGALKITIEGPIERVTYFEVPVLAIVNEIYFHLRFDEFDRTRFAGEFDKFDSNPGMTFVDFGTRRRHDFGYHYSIYDIYNVMGFCTGTSNVYFAMKHGQKPVGTYAHELVMAYQPSEQLYCNTGAMRAWQETYDGKLPMIYLSDTVGTDMFLATLRAMCKTAWATGTKVLFDGVRHDSGDPFEWGEKVISYYQNLLNEFSNVGLRPLNEITLLFSDSLTFDKARELYEHFKGRVKVAFGIGTYFTNPVKNPLNIVIKLQSIEGEPVVKISDNPEKAMYTPEGKMVYKHLLEDREKFLNKYE